MVQELKRLSLTERWYGNGFEKDYGPYGKGDEDLYLLELDEHLLHK